MKIMTCLFIKLLGQPSFLGLLSKRNVYRWFFKQKIHDTKTLFCCENGAMEDATDCQYL